MIESFKSTKLKLLIGLAWHKHSSTHLLCSELFAYCSNVEIAVLSKSLLLLIDAIFSFFVEFIRVAELGSSQITGQNNSRITKQSQTAPKRRRFFFLLMTRNAVWIIQWSSWTISLKITLIGKREICQPRFLTTKLILSVHYQNERWNTSATKNVSLKCKHQTRSTKQAFNLGKIAST